MDSSFSSNNDGSVVCGEQVEIENQRLRVELKKYKKLYGIVVSKYQQLRLNYKKQSKIVNKNKQEHVQIQNVDQMFKAKVSALKK